MYNNSTVNNTHTIVTAMIIPIIEFAESVAVPFAEFPAALSLSGGLVGDRVIGAATGFLVGAIEGCLVGFLLGKTLGNFVGFREGH